MRKLARLRGSKVRNVFGTAQMLAQGECNKKVSKYHVEGVHDKLQVLLEEMEKTLDPHPPYLDTNWR